MRMGTTACRLLAWASGVGANGTAGVAHVDVAEVNAVVGVKVRAVGVNKVAVEVNGVAVDNPAVAATVGMEKSVAVGANGEAVGANGEAVGAGRVAIGGNSVVVGARVDVETMITPVGKARTGVAVAGGCAAQAHNPSARTIQNHFFMGA
jgi:hypothetical protein